MTLPVSYTHRWLAALSSRALIAGQYKLSLDAARDLLEIAPDDPADVRYTAMLALAKLECDIADLKAFKAEHPRAFAASPIQPRRPDRSCLLYTSHALATRQ